ncbi:Glycosyl transferase family 2 [Marinomonas aquimarina]|uniref:Glycosyl transferase family 2 n=1 Tax=Marinomonas aquimarina TaxID=295068 RepID=A0A1A8T3W2_9GAMM|nr:glycosyltransferase [Marinomonas aquimarina]SBS25764.1 Glycosyl transferase family 2 [Marinomonas aquimarina]
MRNKPRIAVLLAAYQGRQWIETQVDSILKQQGVSVELFISVDACAPNVMEDGTLAWSQALAEQHEQVTLLPYGQRFGGAGANFFHLIKEVDLESFDAMAFADQDDVWLPEKLARAWQIIGHHQYQVYSSNVLAFWPDGREQLIKKSYPQKQLDHFFEAAGPGCTYVFARKAALSLQQCVRQAEEQLSRVALHDWFAYAYCREQGFAWFIDEQAWMRYRQHANNQVGVNTGWRAYLKRIRQVANKSYRQQVLAIAELVNPSLASSLNRFAFRLSHILQLRRRPRDRLALLVMFILCIY